MGDSTVTDVNFGQNVILYLEFLGGPHNANGVAVLYRYLLDKAVHTTSKFCSVAA